MYSFYFENISVLSEQFDGDHRHMIGWDVSIFLQVIIYAVNDAIDSVNETVMKDLQLN